MTQRAIVVDPYSGSTGFATAFRARGVETVAVLSDPEPLPSYARTWFPSEFAEVHYYDGTFEDLVATLRKHDPLCVVPGNEHAVELTARLVEELLPGSGNAPGSALAQRHKGHMAAALERADVPRPRTICTADPAAVQAWLRRDALTGRSLVVKPPKSGGTEDVHLIEPGGDWRAAFDQVLGSTNMFNLRNDSVVVQEYLAGTEFIVDLYSVDGQHGLVDVCRYVKYSKGARIGIYDSAIFEPYDHPDVAALAECAMRAADAVGIRNGSTHAEVMLTEEGPRLIEIASRLSGSCLMIAARAATGDCQIDRTVRHYLDGEFTKGYELRQYTRVLWLGAPNPGVLRNIEVLQAASELATTHDMSLVPNGTVVASTVDAFTELGWIILAHPDKDLVEADYERIKQMERQLVVEPRDG